MAKYGMVIDLTRCTGCQTCVVTCQMHNNQRPGIAWGTVETVETGTWPDCDRFNVPHACMHCNDAPCVAACPTGASTKREEDGIVIVDYEVCTGCGTCIEACPYGARKLNTGTDWFFGAENPAPYEAEGIQRSNVAEKCVFCYTRVMDNKMPYCVEGCFSGARVFGDLDNPESDVNKYIAANGAINVPNSAMYYVKGTHEINLAEALLVAAETAGSQEPEKEEKKSAQGVSPVVIGAGAVVVAGAAVGIGVGVKKSKEKATASNEHDGEPNDAGKDGK